jgi:hypothetical protein
MSIFHEENGDTSKMGRRGSGRSCRVVVWYFPQLVSVPSRASLRARRISGWLAAWCQLRDQRQFHITLNKNNAIHHQQEADRFLPFLFSDREDGFYRY